MLIGRGGAVADLLRVVDALENGSSSAGFVRGEAGIGKSSLLREVQGQLTRRGTRSVYGRGDDLDRGRPFRLVLDLATAIEAVATNIERTTLTALSEAIRITTESGSGSTVSGHVLSDAFVHLVEALAITEPLVLLLDDLQWIDPESAAVLNRIRSELDDLPIALVGSARPDPLPADLAVAFEFATEVSLGPLHIEDLEELAGATIGAAPGPALVRELGRTGGNPFFALELLRGLRSHDRLVFGDGQVDLSEFSLPDEVRLSVLNRIAELTEPAVDLLRAAAVLGSTFTAQELDRLANTQSSDDMLSHAVRLGLLELSESGTYGFRHDLVRAALYDALKPAQLRQLHGRAVTVLAELGAPSTRIASHMLRSDQGADDAALDLLEKTALELQRSSAERSIELAERGLACVEPGSEREMRLLAGMIEPLLFLGRMADCERTIRAVLEQAGGVADLDLRCYLRNALFQATCRQDNVRRAVSDIGEFLLDPEIRATDEALMRLSRAHASIQQGGTEGLTEDAEFALAIGQKSGDTRLQVGAWLVLAFIACVDGFIERAIELAQRGQESRGDDDKVVFADLYHGLLQINADGLDHATLILNEGRERARARGDLSSQASYDWVIAGRHYVAGNFDDCLTEFEVGTTRVASGIGRPQMVLAGRSVVARIHLHRGDFEAAKAEIARGDADMAAGSLVGGDLFLWTKALLLEQEGDSTGALELLDLGFQLTARTRFLISWRSTFPDALRLAADAGRDDLVEQIVSEAERGSAAGGDLASARACALYCRGYAERDPDVLLRATAAYRRSPRVPELARSAATTGALLAEGGRVEQAVLLLREAAGIFGDLRATTDLLPIDQLLRALDSPPVAGRERPTMGWDSLTPSELRVAGLVSQGMTTPAIAQALFVSPNTVNTHLRHAFAKLGVNSRAALAAETVRRNAAT